MEPTPTWDSSTSSSSGSAFAGDFFGFLLSAGAGGAGVGVDSVVVAEEAAKALAASKPGGADASTIAS